MIFGKFEMVLISRPLVSNISSTWIVKLFNSSTQFSFGRRTPFNHEGFFYYIIQNIDSEKRMGVFYIYCYIFYIFVYFVIIGPIG